MDHVERARVGTNLGGGGVVLRRSRHYFPPHYIPAGECTNGSFVRYFNISLLSSKNKATDGRNVFL